MKKCSSIFLIIFLALSLFSFAFISAQDTVTSDKPSDFFTNLKYKLSKLGLFTAEGQSRSCDVNARQTFYVTKYQSISKSEFLSYCGNNPSFLIDTFDTSFGFKAEYRSENIGSGLSAGSDGIWELYCCPYSPCTSNSQCSTAPASNYGTTCNTNYGSCYFSAPTYTTKLYNCVNGNFVSSGTASFGQDRFCSTQSNNNYLDESGNEHCANSPTSSWCTTPTQQTCSQIGTDINACYARTDCMYTRTYTCKTISDAQCTGLRQQDCLRGSTCEWTGTTCQISSSGGNNGGNNGGSGTCNTGADTDCNSQVSRSELGIYISLWIDGSIQRSELGLAIQAWSQG